MVSALGKFHHLGVAVKDIAAAVPVYEDLTGYRLFDGPYHDPIQKVSVAFLRRPTAQDPVIELVAPASDDAPVNNYLRKEVGAYHMCFEVDDVESSISHLRSKSCVLVAAPAPAVAFAGRKIAWLFLPSRQLIEVLERA